MNNFLCKLRKLLIKDIPLIVLLIESYTIGRAIAIVIIVVYLILNNFFNYDIEKYILEYLVK